MKKKMSVRVRVGLDAARASAAIYVVIHHWAAAHNLSNGIGMVLRFGQEAVIVFFLLSGFVIFANEHTRARHLYGYYLRRLRRIYPILLSAMVLSVIVSLANGGERGFTIIELVGNLASLQDVSMLKPGVIVDPFMGNDPLWSLSYEVAFYIVFPGILTFWRAAPGLCNHVIGVVCCLLFFTYIIWPNHFSLVGSYFLLWWAGAMAANAYLEGARDARALLVPLGWLLALCAVAVGSVIHVGFRGVGYFPALHLRHFAVATLMLILFFGPVGRAMSDAVQRISKPIAFIASISFALYALHYPILVRWNVAQSVLGGALAVVLLVGLAIFVERFAMRHIPDAPRSC